MAGLLDFFGERDPNDPVNMGLLNMAAALGTPVRQGGGVGPAFGAFGQGYQSSQQADVRRRLMEAQMEEMKAEAEQRRMPKPRNPVSVTGGYIDVNGNFVRTQQDKEDKDPPEVVLARIAFPGDPARQREAVAAILKRKSEHPPQAVSVMPVTLGEQVYGLTSRGPGAGSLTPPLGPAPVKPPNQRDLNLSPTLQKELVDLETANNSFGLAKQSLAEAASLNEDAYDGFGAVGRARVASNLSSLQGSPNPKADATIKYDNIIKNNAVSTLRAIFGGNPTEGERQVLLDLQASADKTKQQRKEIIDTAINLANKRIENNKKMAERIKSGDFSRLDSGDTATSGAKPSKRVRFDENGNQIQ